MDNIVAELSTTKQTLKQLTAIVEQTNKKFQLLIDKHIQVEKSLDRQNSELNAANERLQKEISKQLLTIEKLTQSRNEAEQRFEQQVNEHRQAETSLAEQASKLSDANKNLKRDNAERQQVIDKLGRSRNELIHLLEQQAVKRKRSKEKLKQYHVQVEQMNAELVTTEESLKQQVNECRELEEMMRENTEVETSELKLPKRPVLNEKKLQSLAEMTKRLSK